MQELYHQPYFSKCRMRGFMIARGDHDRSAWCKPGPAGDKSCSTSDVEAQIVSTWYDSVGLFSLLILEHSTKTPFQSGNNTNND